MAQYRNISTEIFMSDTDVLVTSTILGNNVIADRIARDGSLETNFKSTLWNHLQAALSLAPAATSPPCTVATTGKWRRSAASGTVNGSPTIIYVPAGNSGNLELHRDTGSFTLSYQLNGGSLTSFTDGTVIVVVNGDTLAFQGTSIPNSDFATGFVLDGDTGVQLDVISLYNSTP